MAQAERRANAEKEDKNWMQDALQMLCNNY
jgi:hypothetical protein